MYSRCTQVRWRQLLTFSWVIAHISACILGALGCADANWPAALRAARENGADKPCCASEYSRKQRRLWLQGAYESCLADSWVMSCMFVSESSLTYSWVLSHMSMSHVSRVRFMSYVLHVCESCLTYSWVLSHMFMSHVSRAHESCLTCSWVMSHMSMSHVSCHILGARDHADMSHMFISYITHGHESCLTYSWGIF